MKYFLFIVTFIIVLFLYLHIWYYYKTGDDLEVYSIEQPSKDKLEEICNIRQPVIFNYNNFEMLEKLNKEYINNNYGIFDIKIRDVNSKNGEGELFLPFTFKESNELLNNDRESKYITENNGDFLDETALVKTFRFNDGFLRPYMVFNCKYDYLSGSNKSYTNLRYELNFRNYFYCTEGSVNIKLIPPKFSKYLYKEKDYDNFEFYSPINCWNVQDKYKINYAKIKSLDITLNKGEIIYIPAYWWYSIQFIENSSVVSFKYKTFMNSVAISPHIFMKVLQSQNVKLNNNELVNFDKPKKTNNEVTMKISHTHTDVD